LLAQPELEPALTQTPSTGRLSSQATTPVATSAGGADGSDTADEIAIALPTARPVTAVKPKIIKKLGFRLRSEDVAAVSMKLILCVLILLSCRFYYAFHPYAYLYVDGIVELMVNM
jgi:hypothetical protein